MLAAVERRQIIRDGGTVGVHVEIRVAQCVGGIKTDLAQRGHLICGQRHVIVPRDEEKANQRPVVLQTIDADDILLDQPAARMAGNAVKRSWQACARHKRNVAVCVQKLFQKNA